MEPNSKATKQQRGFTITQMVITITIIAIVSTFGVLGIKSARAQFQVQSAARLFASYVEKARADSVRRHAAPGQESSIEIFGEGTTGYAVTMDFGSGAVETRNFQLDPGIDFATAAQKVSFDWRGRLTVPCAFTKSCVFQVRSIYLQLSIPVDVSGSGDITVDEQHFPDQLIPAVQIAEVTGDVDNATPTPTPTPQGTPAVEDSPDPDNVDPTPTPTATPTPTPTPNGNGNGNGNDGNNGNPNNGNPHASPTPTPSVSPTPTDGTVPQCTTTISPTNLFLSQSVAGNQTGSATFTMTNASGVRIISASQAGSGNSLTLGLSLQRIDGSGSSTITVTTKNGAGNRGVFVVQVAATPACGSPQQLTVTVSN